MSEWGQWPPPPRPPRTFAPRWVVGGVAAGIAVTIGLPLVSVNVPGLGPLGFLGALVVPLVVGVVLAATQGTPSRRGFGLGLLIGWGASFIVGAGLCVVLVIGLNGRL
jgi:hypothetical protein